MARTWSRRPCCTLSCERSDAKAASAYLRENRNVGFRVRLELGAGRCRFYTCDLTTEYVNLNADYTT